MADTIEPANVTTSTGRIQELLGSDIECKAVMQAVNEGVILLGTDSHRIQTLLETAFVQQSLTVVLYEETGERRKRIKQIKVIAEP